MNDNHRKLILFNIDKLIDKTEYRNVLEGCLRRNVITQIMADIIETDGTDELDKSRLLFKKLTHRGPAAFQNLVEILKENNFDEAVKLLSASTVANATFDSENVMIDKDNKTLSIKTTREINRTISYSPPNPSPAVDTNGNNEQSVTSYDGTIPSKLKKNKLEPYLTKTSFQIEPNPEVKRATDFGMHPKLGVYKMKSKKRGVFFFVNIIQFKEEKNKRNGADKDRENLVTLFREMNFTVFYYEDLTRLEFHHLMRELVKSNYLKNAESFIFCIQTHGDLQFNQTIMEFSDGQTMCVEDVIAMFSNTNCKDLAGKPKVFFFPFCRGTISDTEKKTAPVRIETDGQNMHMPSFSDILICYGTVPGFVTHRDTGFGSWYVREMCKIFAEHACDLHLEDMLKMVGTKTLDIRDAGRLQVASTESRGFNKLLFFNPKISE